MKLITFVIPPTHQLPAVSIRPYLLSQLNSPFVTSSLPQHRAAPKNYTTMVSVSSIFQASLAGSIQFLVLNGAGALLAYLTYWNESMAANLSSGMLTFTAHPLSSRISLVDDSNLTLKTRPADHESLYFAVLSYSSLSPLTPSSTPLRRNTTYQLSAFVIDINERCHH